MALRHKVGLLGLAAAVAASVGPVVFAANQGNVAAGSTIIGWKYTEKSPTDAGITVVYSNNQFVSVDLGGVSWLQNTPSWTNPDAVAPLIAAYQHEPAQIASVFPAGIGLKFSPNVSAALTVQDFNPSQVGGQPLAPSASTLTSATTSWLDSTGWSGALATYEAGQTTTTKPSTQPSSPPQSPKPTNSTAPSSNTPPKVSTQPPKTTTSVTQHTTTPKSLPVATKTQPVSVPPSVSVSPSSVPLPPKTPYLAHHHVPRSHAVVADASHPQHQVVHHTSPWPWVAGGVVVVGGAVVWVVRRRMA